MTQNRECLFSGYDTNGPTPGNTLDISPEASEAELLEGLGREICPREDCRLVGATLLRYFSGESGTDALHEIGGQVPDGCEWFNMPLTGETIDVLRPASTAE